MFENLIRNKIDSLVMPKQVVSTEQKPNLRWYSFYQGYTQRYVQYEAARPPNVHIKVFTLQV